MMNNRIVCMLVISLFAVASKAPAQGYWVKTAGREAPAGQTWANQHA